MKDKKLSKVVTFFVKDAVLQHVGIQWLTESKYQVKFNIEENFPNWIQNKTWYNTRICSHLSGSYFEEFFNTTQQDRYDLMCYVDAYDKLHPTCYDYVSSGGV